MKKIFLIGIFLLLTSSVFAQVITHIEGQLPQDDNSSRTTGVMQFYADTTTTPWTFYSVYDTNGVSGTKIVGNDSLGYATNTISTVEVLGGDVTTKKVIITNYTSGSILYVGGDNSVTASNGVPLNYLDTYTLTVSNLNKVWLISSSSTDVRYNYEN